MTAPTLFTLGYERRTLDDFLAVLQGAAIDVAIDVRETAWSHRAGFARAALSAALAARDIAYVHAAFTGNPKRFRARALAPAECLRLYRRHLDAHPDIVGAFDELVGRCLDGGKRVCLVCYERSPRDCHRGVLAEYWRRGFYRDVRHLGVETDPLTASPIAPLRLIARAP